MNNINAVSSTSNVNSVNNTSSPRKKHNSSKVADVKTKDLFPLRPHRLDFYGVEDKSTFSSTSLRHTTLNTLKLPPDVLSDMLTDLPEIENKVKAATNPLLNAPMKKKWVKK